MPYYHGSPAGGIASLVPPPGGVIYLTNCRAYALFYIRDLAVNHVTCGVAEDGVVVYDEQFPGQLRALYAGRSGWLYTCGDSGLVPGRSPWIAALDRAVSVIGAERIPDAYEAIRQEMDAGAVRVRRYEDKTEEQKRDITEMTVGTIFKHGMLEADTPKARFIEQSFPQAWAYAANHRAQAAEYIERWEKAHAGK